VSDYVCEVLSKKHDRKQFGCGVDALSRCVRSAEEIAATLIVVDAKDETAVAFYQNFGFAPLPKLTSRSFLPMATASKL